MQKNKMLTLALATVLTAPSLSFAQMDPTEYALKYRQSRMTLIGANMGPMAAMVKGEIPWDQAALEAYAKDLAAVASTNFQRGYIPGSEKGKTKAKPEIWSNMEDFTSKGNDLAVASAALPAAAAKDKAAFIEQFKKVGGACKSCHDDYRSKDFLNQ